MRKVSFSDTDTDDFFDKEYSLLDVIQSLGNRVKKILVQIVVSQQFLEAVASLGLVVSLSQSVMESVCNVLVKLDKVSIGGSRESPV